MEQTIQTRNEKSGRAWEAYRHLREFGKAERHVIFAFLISRAVIWGVASLALRWFKAGTFFPEEPQRYLWDLFYRWDSGWFLSIVENGYGFLPGKESSVAFFPLYPLASGMIAAGLGVPVAAAGFFLSNLSLLAAAIILRRLVLVDFADRPHLAMRSVWLLLFTPAAVFYSAFYSESLFLFLSLLSYYCARQGSWAGAGVAGALLSATRSNGIVLLPALVWEAWRQNREAVARRNPEPRSRVAWLALVPLGLASYMAFLHFRFHDSLAFLKAQAAWSRKLAPPWASLLQAWLNPGAYAWFFIGSAAAGVLLLFAAGLVRVRTSMLIYAALLVFLALSSNMLESVPRYLSAAFPLYIALAALTDRSETIFTAAIALSVALMTLCIALFVCGYWMT